MESECEGFLEDRRLPQVIDETVSWGDFKRPEQFPAFGVGLVDLQHFGMLVIDLVQIGKVDFFNSPIQGKGNAGHGLFAFKSGDGEVRLSAYFAFSFMKYRWWTKQDDVR